MSERAERLRLAIKQCEVAIDDSYMRFSDARKLLDAVSLVLLEYDRVEKSRDNWKMKFMELKK